MGLHRGWLRSFSPPVEDEAREKSGQHAQRSSQHGDGDNGGLREPS